MLRHWAQEAGSVLAGCWQTDMAEIIILLIAGFVGFIFFCHIPIIPLIRIAKIDIPDKSGLVKCVIEAWLKNMLTIIPDLLAPVVVPVVLLFTKWEDDHLPRLFWWWDNDASINGDKRTDDPSDGLGGWALKPVPLERDSPEAIAMCYWAKGHHPRSFYARWVWLGLRNRASSLSQALGTDATGPSTVWNGPTWTVTRVGDKWRYFERLPIGRILIRMHCGYKVPRLPGEEKAAAVSIGFSLRKA